ncbi:type III-B CRISPR module-associated protein Cmr5 [Natronosporangium hydrolyticum]|uniref:CRISPR type III-B/RAMP module-associated protein Cmr5 n=1 Tax=Natronosporangium hydrolyticum TaxID=2811111 RepID=A0A895YL85_9ACTN|nr:type III-B CRISPR module-associated protein Cmr5 [Natronosporangium hydrolyticum]QSB16752.1 type III-B CRISPR module-associated protein Cmr5 [Natronosporangium hydrolyticum]
MSGGQVRRVDQRMAAAAANMLQEKVSPELRTRYRQLPVQVRISGLAATYAYLLGKSKENELGEAYKRVADGIRDHLITCSGLIDAADAATNEKLLRALADVDTSVYARASAEVQALAGWLSRLAEARYLAASGEANSEGRS